MVHGEPPGDINTLGTYNLFSNKRNAMRHQLSLAGGYRDLVVGNGQYIRWAGRDPSGVRTYASKSSHGECVNSKVVGMGRTG